MLSMLLAMLETEEDRERFLKLHGAYEKKLYAVAARALGDRTAIRPLRRRGRRTTAIW